MAGRVFIGTSGYAYPLYQLPEAATFAAWRRAAPRRFVFAVKASRYLTHMKKLKDPGPPLRRLLGRAKALDPTLGPVLFQLPPNFPANPERLDRFLAALRRQRTVARLRAVLEVRKESWLVPEIVTRLARARVELCLHDSAQLEVSGPITAPFVYVRRHGTRAATRGRIPRGCCSGTPGGFASGHARDGTYTCISTTIIGRSPSRTPSGGGSAWA
jgi:uncharacterized protein YecE (DUF72 family)